MILAGGRATRMGGKDKGLIELNGKPMVEYVIESLRPQVKTIIINANRNQQLYARYGFSVIGDDLQGFQGPLAGMASAMRAASTAYVLTVPCDGPLVPDDLVKRMYNALQNQHAELSVAHDGERMQPVFALLVCTLLPSLEHFLRAGQRKIDLWYEEHQAALADFSDRPETFLNINTPQEREALEARMTEHEL